MVDFVGSLLDGIVGPGSEWFWAAAQFVVVVITLAGIYRQLRAQTSANAFHQMATLHERWESDRQMRARLALALHFRGRMDHASAPLLMTPICDFFDDIAILTEGGHLARKDVWLDWKRTIEFWWTILGPAIRERRQLYPGDYEPLERLNGLMRDMDRKAGQVNEFDPVTVSRILDDLIAYLPEALRLDQESRAGVPPTVPSASAQPEAGGELPAPR